MTKVIYSKTHKTGSTTLQNIFYRFGAKNDLMFLLPKGATNVFYGKITKEAAELHENYRNVRYYLLIQYSIISIMIQCMPDYL